MVRDPQRAEGDQPDTILIVDDEESVRKTFREWLEKAPELGCRVLTASDAETALTLASKNPIDLAILDWNLGAGDNGLQLLEDLRLFHQEVVAIMVTGFAHQATPLAAMRMGVRDYLDKNQELNMEALVSVVRRQLESIRPAKRHRRLYQGLVAFRAALEKVLPLVQATTALQDPVPLPEAVRSLIRFLMQTTRATGGVILSRSYDPERTPAEVVRAYDPSGQPVEGELAPFSSSVAGSVCSLQGPHSMSGSDLTVADGGLQLQPFEKGRVSILAAPLLVTHGTQVVVELFDKRGERGEAVGFTPADRELARASADFGAELLRQALAERQSQQVLVEAVAAALEAGDHVARSLQPAPISELTDPPPEDVLQRLREGLRDSSAPVDPGPMLRLAEAVRVLAIRYGPAAVDHCTRLVEGVRGLLDQVTGVGEEGRP